MTKVARPFLLPLVVLVTYTALVNSAVGLPRSIRVAPKAFPTNLCTLRLQPQLKELDVNWPCVAAAPTVFSARYGSPKVFEAKWLPPRGTDGRYAIVEIWTGPAALASNFEHQYSTVTGTVVLGSWAREETTTTYSTVASWVHGVGIDVQVAQIGNEGKLGSNLEAQTFALAKAVAAQF